jgi:hypothetical protein
MIAGQVTVAGRPVQSVDAYYFVCPPAHLAFDKVASFRTWLLHESKLFAAPPGALAASGT